MSRHARKRRYKRRHSRTYYADRVYLTIDGHLVNGFGESLDVERSFYQCTCGYGCYDGVGCCA